MLYKLMSWYLYTSPVYIHTHFNIPVHSHYIYSSQSIHTDSSELRYIKCSVWITRPSLHHPLTLHSAMEMTRMSITKSRCIWLLPISLEVYEHKHTMYNCKVHTQLLHWLTKWKHAPNWSLKSVMCLILLGEQKNICLQLHGSLDLRDRESRHDCDQKLSSATM